ncbi:hypothetical protein M7I_2748 [Glarea lozoyensis 74030]|uniref:Uncharacterized protein n=1 Tax=Glarea lozoyensis (strain ATCC 74030 / MF5533) TaxID=1104152 RepID=H0EJL9_GLAL7|nr:hypothetical protein M7I_2748 [Glarea lozoyensis 74030]
MLLLNIVLLTTSTQILASQFAEPLPRFLDSRADTSGGWALTLISSWWSTFSFYVGSEIIEDYGYIRRGVRNRCDE